MGSLFDVKTRNELADVLNIPRRHLTYILYIQRPDNCYTTFEIPKKVRWYLGYFCTIIRAKRNSSHPCRKVVGVSTKNLAAVQYSAQYCARFYTQEEYHYQCADSLQETICAES